MRLQRGTAMCTQLTKYPRPQSTPFCCSTKTRTGMQSGTERSHRILVTTSSNIPVDF